MLGTQLSSPSTGKGRNPRVPSKPLDVSHASPLLILSSTLQACAVTFSVLIRKQRLWEVVTARGPTSPLRSKAPALLLLDIADSE